MSRPLPNTPHTLPHVRPQYRIVNGQTVIANRVRVNETDAGPRNNLETRLHRQKARALASGVPFPGEEQQQQPTERVVRTTPVPTPVPDAGHRVVLAHPGAMQSSNIPVTDAQLNEMLGKIEMSVRRDVAAKSMSVESEVKSHKLHNAKQYEALAQKYEIQTRELMKAITESQRKLSEKLDYLIACVAGSEDVPFGDEEDVNAPVDEQGEEQQQQTLPEYSYEDPAPEQAPQAPPAQAPPEEKPKRKKIVVTEHIDEEKAAQLAREREIQLQIVMKQEEELRAAAAEQQQAEASGDADARRRKTVTGRRRVIDNGRPPEEGIAVPRPNDIVIDESAEQNAVLANMGNIFAVPEVQLTQALVDKMNDQSRRDALNPPAVTENPNLPAVVPIKTRKRV